MRVILHIKPRLVIVPNNGNRNELVVAQKENEWKNECAKKENELVQILSV